ncbi:hypothetical protein OIE67_15385 [Nonomuraea fuscirosea]|uniref:hypothetical protein n=1 Tax=Nonomuraea fuscirosea TaxID=1291556 RepID=UPI002DDAFA8A|nr:hypothetical protein [Nonomuraea fuscirosea]WSA55934.1 hypothetical protein OIE67_15385 [Nonomuraea fuscirosea]
MRSSRACARSRALVFPVAARSLGQKLSVRAISCTETRLRGEDVLLDGWIGDSARVQEAGEQFWMRGVGPRDELRQDDFRDSHPLGQLGKRTIRLIGDAGQGRREAGAPHRLLPRVYGLLLEDISRHGGKEPSVQRWFLC